MTPLPFLAWLRQQKDRHDNVGELARFAIRFRRTIRMDVRIATNGERHDCPKEDIADAFEIAHDSAMVDYQDEVMDFHRMRAAYQRAWKEWLLVLNGQEILVEIDEERR